jgi:hypothetical protein
VYGLFRRLTLIRLRHLAIVVRHDVAEEVASLRLPGVGCHRIGPALQALLRVDINPE